MTASTVPPVSMACRTAQRRAPRDDGEPSTPTTMRGALLFLVADIFTRSLRVIAGQRSRRRVFPHYRHGRLWGSRLSGALRPGCGGPWALGGSPPLRSSRAPPVRVSARRICLELGEDGLGQFRQHAPTTADRPGPKPMSGASTAKTISRWGPRAVQCLGEPDRVGDAQPVRAGFDAGSESRGQCGRVARFAVTRGRWSGFLAGQRGSAGGVAFPDLGGKVLTAGKARSGRSRRWCDALREVAPGGWCCAAARRLVPRPRAAGRPGRPGRRGQDGAPDGAEQAPGIEV